MKSALLAATVLLGFSVPYAAQGAVVLTLGQSANAQAITATANAAGTSTTIVAADAAVTVTQIDAATVVTPAAAFFDMHLASVGAAAPLAGGAFQHFAGTFSVRSAAGGSGTNYLSGSFADIVFGNGSSGVLAAGGLDPISFTSSVIPVLDVPRAVALAFANLSPGFTLDNTTIASFTSSVSGTFSANPAAVPEPLSLAVLGVGLLGLAMVKRRKPS